MTFNNWISTELRDLCLFLSRGITPAYDVTGVKVINQKCIRNNRVSLDLARFSNLSKRSIPANKYLQQYDTLVNSTGEGTLGRVATIKNATGQITVDSHVTIVRAKPGIDKLFLGYALQNVQSQIESLAEGSTGQTELSKDRLGAEIMITYPEKIEEQRAIAATLSCLDDKIELNKRMNKTLEEMAQAIFKSWFVDFEPFQDGEFVDSELGRIPKGWRVGVLDECIEL